jgi:hypothetical protein
MSDKNISKIKANITGDSKYLEKENINRNIQRKLEKGEN